MTTAEKTQAEIAAYYRNRLQTESAVDVVAAIVTAHDRDAAKEIIYDLSAAFKGRDVYDDEGNRGEVIGVFGDEIVVDWVESGGEIEVWDDDNLRGVDDCLICGSKNIKWNYIQTKQFEPNWIDGYCPDCGARQEQREEGGRWVR